MSLLRRVPWWVWLLVPGGFIILPLLQRRRPAAPSMLPKFDRALAAQEATMNLVESAKVQAETLRRQIGSDPLVAKLIGIDSTLINQTPAEHAADQSQADVYRDQIAKIEDQIAYANSRYGQDHFGGQTPDQFASYIGSLEAKIRSIMTKLGGLFA